MTTIIAVETPKGIIFGSDSQITSVGKEVLDGPKFFKHGNVIFGNAGRHRLVQELRYGRKVPRVKGDPTKYIHKKLLPFIAEAMEKADLRWENELIVAVKGSAYKIGVDNTVIRSPDGVYVIGSGSAYASAYLSQFTEFTEEKVLDALRVAAKHDPYTSAPFYVSTGL